MATTPRQIWTAQDSQTNVVSWPDTSDQSRLYYEAHVTVPPLDNATAEIVDSLCSARDWRRSTFEMHAGGEVPNAFVSCRDKSRISIISRVAEMIKALMALGLPVLRWKVEDTLLDSRQGDRLLPGGENLAPTVPRQGIYSENDDTPPPRPEA